MLCLAMGVLDWCGRASADVKCLQGDAAVNEPIRLYEMPREPNEEVGEGQTLVDHRPSSEPEDDAASTGSEQYHSLFVNSMPEDMEALMQMTSQAALHGRTRDWSRTYNDVIGASAWAAAAMAAVGPQILSEADTTSLGLNAMSFADGGAAAGAANESGPPYCPINALVNQQEHGEHIQLEENFEVL